MIYKENRINDDNYQWANLNLAIQINQFSFAKRFIAQKNFGPILNEELFYVALINDIPEIVEFLMDNDFDIEKWLNSSVLLGLYQNLSQEMDLPYQVVILQKQILNIFREYYWEDTQFNFLQLKENDKKMSTERSLKYPVKNLFIFCLLTNRIEMAKLFWEKDDVSFSKF